MRPTPSLLSATPRRATDAGANHDRTEEFGGVFDGTVGWDQVEEHFDVAPSPGDRLRDITLVRVTLFEGRNADTDGELPNDGLAHGTQILARLNGVIDSVPPKGSQVVVAAPARRLLVPGGPIIIGAPKPQLLNPGDGEYTLWSPSGYAGIRLKKDGVFIFTSLDGTKDGKLISLGITATSEDGITSGFEFVHPFMRATMDSKGVHITTSAGAELHFGPQSGFPPPLDALASVFKIGGAVIDIEGSAISLGTAGGVPEPLAKATTLQAVLGVFNSALVAMQASLAALHALGVVVDPDPVGKPAAITASSVALGTSATSVGAVATALTAALATLPSGSTQGT